MKTIKEYYQDGKDWCSDRVKDVQLFYANNKEFVHIMLPIFGGAAVEIMRGASKAHAQKENQRLKERYVYDRSNGHYYETRRKLKNREWRMIDERKANGEPLRDILNDMRVLK